MSCSSSTVGGNVVLMFVALVSSVLGEPLAHWYKLAAKEVVLVDLVQPEKDDDPGTIAMAWDMFN